MLAANRRVIMISGANRGIGLAIARHLADAGYRLSLGVRDPESMPEVPGKNTLLHRWQAEQPSDSDDWVEATLDRFSQLDGLVLNAGIMRSVGVIQGTEEDLDAMWSVNFKAPWRLSRAAWSALANSGHGRIINVASLSGKRVMSATNLGYSASKYAAMALTHAIRQQGWQDGIRATAICPGLVDTDMVAQVEPPAGQFKIAPSTVAASVAYALSLPNESAVAELLINSRLEPAQ